MKPSEAIRQIMAIEGITPTRLAQMLGITKQALYSRLASPHMYAASVADTVAPMGYRLMLMPQDADIPLDAFPIE